MNFYYHPILGLQYAFEVKKADRVPRKDLEIPQSRFFKNRITSKYN